MDTIVGTAGNDTIIGSIDSTGSPTVATFSLGDSINGGAGIDTLAITVAASNVHNVDLRGETITGVEKLLINDVNNAIDSSNDSFLGSNDFQTVTLQNFSNASVYGIKEGTAIVAKAGQDSTSNWVNTYSNGTAAASVTINDTFQGNSTATNGGADFHHGENNGNGSGLLSNATTINATLNLLNANSANSNYDWADQYIYADNAGNVKTAITVNVNVANATSDGSDYSGAETDVYQNGDATVTANISVTDSADVDVIVYAQKNSTTTDASNNVANITLSNVTNGSTSSEVEAYDFAKVNVNVTGAASLGYLYVTDSNSTMKSQTLTITAAADLKTGETDLNYKGSTATVVTGAGNVALGKYYASNGDSLSSTVTATIDASALTGNFKVNVQHAIQSVKGGSGNDTILIEDVSTFASTDLGGLVVSGGTGTNTVGFKDAGWATIAAGVSADRAAISGFQTLEITNALASSTSADTSYDVSKLAGITNFIANDGVAAGYTATVTGLSADATVTLQGHLGTTSSVENNGALALVLAADTTNDTLNLVINGNYWDANSTEANIKSGRVITADTGKIENLHVDSTATQTRDFTPVNGHVATVVENTLTLTDTALKTLTITGDQMLTWTSAAGETKLATVDASANTAGVKIDVSSIVTTQTLTIKGTVAADTITVGGGADTLTLGGGVDHVVFGAVSASSAVFTTINDIVAKDVLDFSKIALGLSTDPVPVAVLANADGKLGAALTSGVVDYQTFLNSAAGKAAGTVSWFEFGGNTYVVESSGDAHFTAGTDHVVQLVGLHDLSNSVIGHTTATLTIV